MNTINHPAQEVCIGVDIGGTKCSVVIGDKNFDIKRKVVFETRSERGYIEILAEFKHTMRTLLNEFPGCDLKRIGISCGGPLDSKTGIIHSPPNLPGWDKVPVTEIFTREFGVSTALQNDANACALAEWLMGAGRGTSNMVFLTFGTGMGAGLILNGRLYSGTNDLGGEVGHIRLARDGPVGFGKAGSFEGFCSGGGIAQLAKKIVAGRIMAGQKVGFCPSAGMIDEIDAKMVVKASLAGDSVANEIVLIAAEYLGQGLAIIVDILNPECIVIGSIYARNEMLFKPLIEPVLKREAIPAALEVCRILPAELGDSIGDYAALCVALYEDKF
jgi:glucokinase